MRFEEVLGAIVAFLFFASVITVFVASVVAFALAADPPARAAENGLRTWRTLGLALVPLAFGALLELLMPSFVQTDWNSFEHPTRYVVVFFYGLILGSPIAVIPKRIRRVAPTRTIARLMTMVGILVAIWFVLFDFVLRALQGADL
jgi:uncharacterized membrane protein